MGSTPDMWAHVNSSEAEQELMRQVAQMQAAQAMSNANAQAQQGTWLPTLPPQPPVAGQLQANAKTMSVRAREMFLKRMGGLRAELQIAAEDYLHCHVYGEKVYLFYCFAGRDGCVKEGIDLFPSDTLITQFRMVLAT
jgi:hypothetical protein